MIQQFSFLGISLRTQSRRRALVASYYVILLCFLAAALWRERFFGYAIIAQTFTLGGFFGGIRSGGVIKPYSGHVPDPNSSDIQELHLTSKQSFGVHRLLDERELNQRNQAHYKAYALLRWVICLLTAFLFIGMSFAPHFILNNSLNFLWAVTVLVLSLPQSVILWTESDPLPEGDLELVPQA